ncbi:MAG: peptidylprolyl isomerase, partial [Prochlorococcus sp.]
MAKNNSLYPTVYLYSDQSEASLEIQDESTGIAGTVVRFDTNLISDKNQFYVELFNSKGSAAILTPKTANNFLKYVNDNSYQNTFVHRSIDGFMIQAGGFTAPSLQMIAGGIPLEIDSKGPIKNEPGNENIRGTLSMAKLGGDPDSATNQWFINLVDNDFLNSQNGGFTAFGKVLGNGMEVVDMAAKLPTYNFGSPYTDLPLQNLTTTIKNGEEVINLQPDDFLKFTTIAEISDNKDLFTFHVKSSKPKKLSVEVLNNHTINMKPAAAKSGRVQVRVQASSLIDDSKITEHFFVEIPKSKRIIKSLSGSRSNDLLAGDNKQTYTT